MAVRAPLYYNASNQIQEMTTSMVSDVVDQIVYQYSLNPSVALSVVGSGGSLGTLNDTRLQAGASSTSVSAFPSEATTAEPSTVTVNYSKIDQSTASITPTTDTGKTWPVYYNSSGQIQAMNLTDVKDTFLHPAIDLLTAATTTTQQAGTYFISTSTSVAGATEVSGSSTAVFTDTRADTSLYTASGIPETQDQPTTITNYYLHRVNGSDTSYTLPLLIDSSDQLQTYPEATFESLTQEWIRYTAASSTDGYSISYSFSTGTNRGSGMSDTRLNGSGNYQTRFVNANDYRAQEFPNGTAVTVNTYYLRIHKS
jgi:YD repeat-containing protein